MLSRVDAGRKVGEESGNKKLLREIETLSRALYLDKNPARSLIGPASSNRSKSVGKTHLVDGKSKVRYENEEASRKDKKSIWNWKPLKAFSNVKNKKFNCCFTLQVHSVEGLPSMFENVSVRVHWKRRDGELVTRPVKILEGVAEFEEKLLHTCAVYASRSGPYHSAKYEAKHFLLYASVFGAHEFDLGKHRIDLTRFLPLTLEELEEEKSSGKWTTSYKLSGEAKGGLMNVSFGYTVVGDGPISPRGNQNVPELSTLRQNSARTVKTPPKVAQGGVRSTIVRAGSLPGTVSQRRLALSKSVEDVKDLHEVLPTSRSVTSIPVNILHETEDKYAELDCKPELDMSTEDLEPIKSKSCPVSEFSQKGIENEFEDCEFSVIEKGVELSQEEQEKSEDAEIHSQDEVHSNCKDELVVHDCDFREDDLNSKESVMRELESALCNVSSLEALDSPEGEDSFMELKADSATKRKGRSLSLDHVTESVANDFLDMLGAEHSPFGMSSESEPDSPRERLLRQFEKDALASGCSLFDFDIADEASGCSLFDFDITDEEQSEHTYNASAFSELENFSDDFDLPSDFQNLKEEHHTGTPDASRKMKAKVLEDLESEALMREWGLDDKAFQYSPTKGPAGFGSPIDLPPEEPLPLPTLGEGLGPFLKTKDGGFFRTMNPSLFNRPKTGGSLIMQVSSPVVVPAAMGSGITDILQQLASVGIEKLSMQANNLMPLEDITGKTMQQVAWEAAGALEGPERQDVLQPDLEIEYDIAGSVKENSSAPRSNKFGSNMRRTEAGEEYVSLEELAPLAMDKIEALSIEGLRIQSGMSDVDAPANIRAESLGEMSALQGKGVDIMGSLGMEGTAGLQLLDIKDCGDDVDGLMGLSLTLDEWMRFDSGDIGDEDQINERTSQILAAHHASSLDMIRGGSKGERRRGKTGRKGGLLGNNFTVALMVQLRDPLRDYEPVGTPMLALIQVERVFIPPKPKIYCKVSLLRTNDEEDDEAESTSKEPTEQKTSEEEGIPHFQITEVHVSGLKTEPGKKKLWGSAAQQQSGSRWLLANGMGKTNKTQTLVSKPVSIKSAPPLAEKVQPKVQPKMQPKLQPKVQPGSTLWSISSKKGKKW